MSIDSMIRIDHGNDFTLVKKSEFEKNLNELFNKAERIRFDLDGLAIGFMKKTYFDKVNEVEEIISYKDKPEMDKTKIYHKYILLNEQEKVFNIDYESMRQN